MQTKELNNGRLAMIAIAAFAAQEEVNKNSIWKEAFERGASAGLTDAFVQLTLSQAGGSPPSRA